MKRLLLLFLILFPNVISAQIPKGPWFWNSGKGNNSLEFNIISYDNQTLNGSYCSVFDNGNKVDCSSDLDKKSNFSLRKISKNTYQGTFTSNFSFTKGIMKIIFDPLNKKIILEIVEEPEGEYHLPRNAVLSQ